MTLLREYVTALQALLRGETVTTTGRYVNLDRVQLDWPPDRPPELYVGAVGRKTLRLSGELAQGTILVGGTAPEGRVPAPVTGVSRCGLRYAGPATCLTAGHLQGPARTVTQRTDHLLSLVWPE